MSPSPALLNYKKRCDFHISLYAPHGGPTKAVQILGAHGYTKDKRVERNMRDAKALLIVEGANEIQRNIIARELLKGK